jgi:hypothetical protein
MRKAYLLFTALVLGSAHAVNPPVSESPVPSAALPLVVVLPPFEHFRSDYNRATLGSASDPLIITPCLLHPPVEWQREMCARLHGAPRWYPQTHSYNVAQGHDRYWVLAVNDEPAFERGSAGPPNQSLPINTGIVTVEPLAHGVRLGLSGDAAGSSVPGGTPFVSYGLQAGRGYGDASIFGHSAALLSFDVTLERLSGDGEVGDAIHFFIEVTFERGGRRTGIRSADRKMLWLFLGEKNAGFNGSFNWNWPVVDSMWFPGNPIEFLNASDYARRCHADLAQIPLAQASVGRIHHFDIDLEKMVECMAGASADDRVLISGLHFALEANFPGENTIVASFTNISLSRK